MKYRYSDCEDVDPKTLNRMFSTSFYITIIILDNFDFDLNS